MDDLIALQLIALLTFLALLVLLWLAVLVRRELVRLARLEQQVADMDAMLRRRRHTYPTQAGLEDAEAVNLDLVRHINELQLELEAMRARAAQQMEILQLTQKSPHTYPIDRPAGRRPQGRTSDR